MAGLAEPTELAKKLRAALDRHGYGFQFAIVKRALELSQARQSPWSLPVTEFPVEVQGYGTRVDLVLEHQFGRKYLVCECKRADPALSDWCFLRAPFVQDRYLAASFELVRKTENGVQASLSEPIYPQDLFQIAQEVKSAERGNSDGRGRGAIEDATTQILRGLNGLVSYFRNRPEELGREGLIKLIPVIFTTARLWISRVNLADTDPTTGKIVTDETALEERPYVYYQYPQSPGLKHDVPYLNIPQGPRGFSEVLYDEYLRTIVVVSASGVDKYLTVEGPY